ALLNPPALISLAEALRKIKVRLCLAQYQQSADAIRLLDTTPLGFIKLAPKYVAPNAPPEVRSELKEVIDHAHRLGIQVIGPRVYGLGVMALAILCMVWGGFDPGQPVPKDLPYRAVLAHGAAAFMLVAGAAVVWRRTAAWGAAALAAYYALVVAFLMDGRVVL